MKKTTLFAGWRRSKGVGAATRAERGTGVEVNQVYQGDCVEGLARLGEGSIDLVFADPPFNIGYLYHGYNDRQNAMILSSSRLCAIASKSIGLKLLSNRHLIAGGIAIDRISVAFNNLRPC